jgi:hypothetical protein
MRGSVTNKFVRPQLKVVAQAAWMAQQRNHTCNNYDNSKNNNSKNNNSNNDNNNNSLGARQVACCAAVQDNVRSSVMKQYSNSVDDFGLHSAQNQQQQQQQPQPQ